jgi:hypothetical protein
MGGWLCHTRISHADSFVSDSFVSGGSSHLCLLAEPRPE